MSNFFSVLTVVGKAALVNAAATGKTITLTEMAVGDGNGVLVNPTEDMTELVNEVYRAEINALDVEDATTMRAEISIPADQGGFYVREVGIYNSDGHLFAVANLPDTYKPALAEGAGRELTVILLMEISDSDAVTLKIDPTIVLASRKYVDSEISKHSGDAAAHPDKADKGHNHTTDEVVDLLSDPHSWGKGQRYAQTSLAINAGAVVWDMEAAPHAVLELTENVTAFSVTNYKAGATYELTVLQDATGNRSVAWPVAIRWPGGAAVEVTSGANAEDLINFSVREVGNTVIIRGYAGQDFKAVA